MNSNRIAARHVPGEGRPEIQSLGRRTRQRDLPGAARRLQLRHADLGHESAIWGSIESGRRGCSRAPSPRSLRLRSVYSDPQARGSGLALGRRDGRWRPAELRQPSNISRMAELMRRIHALPLPAPPRVMSPAQWIAYYGEASAQRAGAGQCRAARCRRGAAGRAGGAAERQPGALPQRSAPLELGRLRRHVGLARRLVLLDWEYAHVSDPLWDLAGWSANNDLERELQQDLLAQYLGRAPAPDEQLRLRRLAWLYDYVCLLWSELYLNLHGAGQAGTAEEAVALRARLLATRLSIQ